MTNNLINKNENKKKSDNKTNLIDMKIKHGLGKHYISTTS
jgi:hypothetical protein